MLILGLYFSFLNNHAQSFLLRFFAAENFAGNKAHKPHFYFLKLHPGRNQEITHYTTSTHSVYSLH